MKCGAEKNTTCMARHGDQCMEHLMTDTPSCSSRVAITNADRIRGMTDEEFAKIIAAEIPCELIPFCKEKPECMATIERGEYVPDEMCIECAIDWLQQPAKE